MLVTGQKYALPFPTFLKCPVCQDITLRSIETPGTFLFHCRRCGTILTPLELTCRALHLSVEEGVGCLLKLPGQRFCFDSATIQNLKLREELLALLDEARPQYVSRVLKGEEPHRFGDWGWSCMEGVQNYPLVHACLGQYVSAPAVCLRVFRSITGQVAQVHIYSTTRPGAIKLTFRFLLEPGGPLFEVPRWADFEDWGDRLIVCQTEKTALELEQSSLRCDLLHTPVLLLRERPDRPFLLPCRKLDFVMEGQDVFSALSFLQPNRSLLRIRDADHAFKWQENAQQVAEVRKVLPKSRAACQELMAHCLAASWMTPEILHFLYSIRKHPATSFSPAFHSMNHRRIVLEGPQLGIFRGRYVMFRPRVSCSCLPLSNFYIQIISGQYLETKPFWASLFLGEYCERIDLAPWLEKYLMSNESFTGRDCWNDFTDLLHEIRPRSLFLNQKFWHLLPRMIQAFQPDECLPHPYEGGSVQQSLISDAI